MTSVLPASAGFVQVGSGLAVFQHDETVEGPVVWLDSPQAVLDFVSSGAVRESIVLARGGTTTFLVPALSAGVKGVLTLQGAPESHLGILTREYGIPCVMSVSFTEGVTSSRGETIPPDGAIVRLDASGAPQGRVLVAEADRDYGTAAATPVTDPAAEAMAAQLAALLASYRGEIAEGPRGHRQMSNRLRSGVLDADSAKMHRDARPDELADFLAYAGWNLWDLIKARSTEGESGLIPRQEYETVSFVQQWGVYPSYFRQLTETVGVDGLIAMGALPRNQFGNRTNLLSIYSSGLTPLVGRGIAAALGLARAGDDAEDLNTVVCFLRRLQYGFWGDGPGFASGRGYRVPVLSDEWLTRLRDCEHRFDGDADALSAFRHFNATTELAGFLTHYDCRVGMGDTGPYPLPDGGFVLVRDHFLHEPALEWAQALDGLPHCVTQAMFFRPDTPIDIRINDIATTFASPANYLKYLSGAAVFARDSWDSPSDKVRQIDAAEMARIADACNVAMLQLYADIAAQPWEERIRNGVKVYCRLMLLPWMRTAGLWGDTVPAEFDVLSPVAEQAFPVLIGGEAMQVLGGVFLLGHGLVPESGLGEPLLIGPEAFPQLHRVALRGSVPDLPGVEALLDAEVVVETAGGYLLTERGRARHAELLSADREGLDLTALATLYDRFLALNEPMKSLSARAAAASDEESSVLVGDFATLVERAGSVLRRVAGIAPRFGSYESRLEEALTQVERGKSDYLTSPVVESVHTIWMELHEDFLQTLDRDREAEGSY
jgi:hypothetical protein